MGHLLMVAAWLLMVVGAIWLVILPGAGGYFGITSVWFRLPSTIALAAGLGIWQLVALRRPFWRPRSSLSQAFVASIAALALSLALSIRPALGADYLAYGVLLTGAYLLLVRLFAHPYFGPRFGGLAVLLCLGLCIWYIPRVLAQWVEFWSAVGRITTPPLRPEGEALAYGNPGTLATMVILLWLASLAHIGFRSRRARAGVITLSIPVGFVVLVTAARGAWVGLAVAAAVCVVVWLMDREHRQSIHAAIRVRSVRIALVVGSTAAAAILVALLPAILRRLAEPASEVRSVFNATALRMFEDSPLTGLGPGMWPVERIRYTLSGEQDYYIPHAHNLYLQTLAEVGLVGLAVGVLVLGLVAWLILRGMRSLAALERRLAWASLFALVYLGTHQLFDFYANLPSVAFALALSVGRLDALVPAAPFPWQLRRLTSPSASRAGLGVLAVSLFLATVWLVRAEGAAIDGQLASDRANRGDWAAALPAAQAAADAAPDMSPYQFTYGLSLAHAGRTSEALTAMRNAAIADDYPLAWLNVAALELELGNEAEATAALDQALRVGNQNPQVDLGAMALYLRMGEATKASEAAASALLPLPTLASDPLWHSSPALERTFAEALPLAMGWADPRSAIRIALEAGLIDEAVALVDSLEAPEQAYYQRLLDGWQGDASAFEALNAEASASPLDSELAATCHRVAAQGRSTGHEWRCTATPLEHAPVIRMGLEPDGRQQLPGPNAPWHFQYVYRRLAPFDELVPGLPRLVWTAP